MRAYFNPNKYEQRNWCHLNPVPQTIGLIQKLTEGSIQFSLSLAKADPSIAWARFVLFWIKDFDVKIIQTYY